jgi:peptide/nickel transport system permease protein
MARYIIRRLLWVIVLLFLVSLVTFVVFFLLPTGDPAALRAGRSATPSVIESIRHSLGLDRSKPYQYWHYMQGILPYIDFSPHFKLGWHFDLGTSYFQSSAPVRTLIFDRLPATLSLTFGAVIIWVIAGVGVGIISAVRQRSFLDRFSMGAALVAISAPVFWLGLVCLFLFAKDIGRIPIFDGANSYPNAGLFAFTPKFAIHPANFGSWFGSLLLPWLVLAASFAAFYARLLRSNLIEVMGEDYIRTARAKGLPERQVIMRHGVRSAITPVITALGLDIGILLGGAILTESVFNIPGIGRLAYDSIIHSDLPVIQGTVLFGAFFIVLSNLIVDIGYAFLDPRVRYS